MSDYQPVSCGVHSEYELLAMHRDRVKIVCTGEGGKQQTSIGKVIDVSTREQAEYLVLEVGSEDFVWVRLDKIQSLKKL